MRTALFGLAAALGLGSALGWRWQRPWADPAHPPRGAAWFFTPTETNAWIRLGAHASGFLAPPVYGPRQAQRSPIEDLAANDSHVFVAFNDGTIARYSEDEGWQQSRLDVPHGPGPMSVVFLGELEGYAVAGTGAVFRTSDGGARWEKLIGRETLPPLFAVDAYAGVLWAVAEKEALFSRDHGLTWTHFPLESVPPEGWMAEHPVSGGRAPGPLPRSWLLSASPNPPKQKQSYQAPQAQTFDPLAAPRPAPAPSYAREERARPPDGAYQVCATPTETWLLTPSGAFTVFSRAGADRLQPAFLGPKVDRANVPVQVASDSTPSPLALSRCVRSRFDVIGLVAPDGISWRRPANGGEWQRSTDPLISDMAMLAGGAAPSVVLVGPGGFASSAGPIPWRRDLRRVVLGANGAWILDRDDSLWHQEGDAVERAVAFRSSITAAAEPERNVLLASTSTGLLLRSRDLGRTWTVEAAFDRPVAAIGQLPDRRWAALQPDPPPWKGWLERKDAPWEEAELTGAVTVAQAPHPDGSATYPPLNDLGAALGDSWFRNFVPPAMVAQSGASAVFVTGGPGPSTAWGVGSRCRLFLALSADSAPEERTVEGCTATLRDVAVSGSAGWAVGDRGTVLRSTDGGQTWERVAFPSQAALTAVLVSSGGERVTVFGDGDTIRWTEDGGQTWRAPQNRLYPAPWCLFAVALALTLGAAGARTKVPPEVVGSHIEDLLASDAPITDERQDVLGQAEVARTIAYFLQNDRTEAPLTLAVTGEWGTGKSSVLNLVRKRLRRSGMPVIGFNAWHHQQDADPLAALYAAIVRGAVPRGPARAEYRLRLLATRWRKRAWMLAVIALLGSFLLGLYFKAPHYSHDAFQQISPVVTCFFSDCPEVETKKDARPASGENSQVEKAHAHTFWGGGLATLVLVAPILASLFRSLRSFGVNPSALLRAVSGGRGDDRELVTFHAQFADEFADVTKALGRRRLVLLIDDLDRCAPDSLLKVLEAMNFLVSSGKCFVVLAMSRGIVLESLAAQLPDAGGGTPVERADRYLQKLINVEVALPQLSPHRGKSLITGAGARAASTDEPAERSAISRAAAWGLGAAVALTAAALVFNAGARLGEAAESSVGTAELAEPLPADAFAFRPPPAPTVSTPRANEEKEKGSRRGDANLSPPAPRAPAPAVRLPERWTIEEPERPARSLWAVLPWVVLIWAGLLTLAVSSSPRPMTTDSRDFREALERWCEVIQLRQPTPRALKRFLNRLRFWAMRLRAEKEPEQVVSPWQRLFSRGPAARGDPEAMSEGALVALAALHEVRAELVTEPGALSGPLDADPPAVKAALDAERAASGHPTEEDRLKFLQLLGTVKA
jgi:photosystem II stability/assembly factor-like uncharacterized protein